VISLLYQKIDIFEKVIGELDDILERLNIRDFEREMRSIIEKSNSEGEARIKLGNLFSIVEDLYRNEGVNG